MITVLWCMFLVISYAWIIWILPGISSLEVMLGLVIMVMMEVSLTSPLWVLGGGCSTPRSPPLPKLTQRFLESPLEGGHCRCQTWVQKQFLQVFSLQAYSCFSCWRGGGLSLWDGVAFHGCSSVLVGKMWSTLWWNSSLTKAFVWFRPVCP